MSNLISKNKMPVAVNQIFNQFAHILMPVHKLKVGGILSKYSGSGLVLLSLNPIQLILVCMIRSQIWGGEMCVCVCVCVYVCVHVCVL